jgi:GT2 family glycosyltransferase
MPKEFTIITPYHFGPERLDDHARLLRSLRASLREVEGKGKIILVANGTEREAGDPSKVMHDLSVAQTAQIEVVTLRNNVGSVGGLNAGIERALAARNIPGDDEWIGKVDSSAVLETGWLDQIGNKLETSTADAAFGRQLLEGDPNTIYSDGHRLSSGLTTGVNYDEERSAAEEVPPGAFPCLGASLFSPAIDRAHCE